VLFHPPLPSHSGGLTQASATACRTQPVARLRSLTWACAVSPRKAIWPQRNARHRGPEIGGRARARGSASLKFPHPIARVPTTLAASVACVPVPATNAMCLCGRRLTANSTRASGECPAHLRSPCGCMSPAGRGDRTREAKSQHHMRGRLWPTDFAELCGLREAKRYYPVKPCFHVGFSPDIHREC
jgi:hypothetical protein